MMLTEAINGSAIPSTDGKFKAVQTFSENKLTVLDSDIKSFACSETSATEYKGGDIILTDVDPPPVGCFIRCAISVSNRPNSFNIPCQGIMEYDAENRTATINLSSNIDYTYFR